MEQQKHISVCEMQTGTRARTLIMAVFSHFTAAAEAVYSTKAPKL